MCDTAGGQAAAQGVRAGAAEPGRACAGSRAKAARENGCSATACACARSAFLRTRARARQRRTAWAGRCPTRQCGLMQCSSRLHQPAAAAAWWVWCRSFPSVMVGLALAPCAARAGSALCHAGRVTSYSVSKQVAKQLLKSNDYRAASAARPGARR
jgi:hypothetical protein